MTGPFIILVAVAGLGLVWASGLWLMHSLPHDFA